MSIEKLDYFISAATNSSFTKAARECGVAQSAISQQIACAGFLPVKSALPV